MESTTNLFQAIFEKVDMALADYVTSTAGDVISFITPIFTSMLIIWVWIWGFMLMYGKASEPLQDGVYRILRITFIMTLGLSVGTYTGVVVDFLAKGPETIASVITGSPMGTSAATLDSLFSKVFAVSKQAYDKGGIMNGNFGMYLIAWAILVVGIGLTIVVAFLILLSKVITTVLLAVGPLFIVMLLFQATQRFFESWLGMVLNFGFILILAAAIGQLMTSLADSYISAMAADGRDLANLGDAAMLCVVFGLCSLVVKQVPSIASALGGGVAIATQGALSGAMNAMRPSTMRRQWMGVKRDARFAKHAAGTPFRGVKSGYSAYQKRFGSGNSMTGS